MLCKSNEKTLAIVKVKRDRLLPDSTETIMQALVNSTGEGERTKTFSELHQ